MTNTMLKEDGSVDQMVLDGLDCPSLYPKSEQPKRLRWILAKFEASHRTESAFYLTFCSLHRNDVSYLMGAFDLDRDWDVFRRLCRTYQVREA